MIGKIISAAAVFTAAAGVTAMKKKNICPVCEVKKLISKCGVHIKAAGEYGNNAALTPPMGWSSWNTFRNNINEQLILDTADAMKKSGLLDAGYQYVNLTIVGTARYATRTAGFKAILSHFPRVLSRLCSN